MNKQYKYIGNSKDLQEKYGFEFVEEFGALGAFVRNYTKDGIEDIICIDGIFKTICTDIPENNKYIEEFIQDLINDGLVEETKSDIFIQKTSFITFK